MKCRAAEAQRTAELASPATQLKKEELTTKDTRTRRKKESRLKLGAQASRLHLSLCVPFHFFPRASGPNWTGVVIL